jgi:enoyl-CoA hydratase/carnithine racemase
MAEQDESPILVQRRGHLLALVLNRPRVLNALNLEMIRRLSRSLEAVRGDDGIRLVLLAGAGERGFCTGGDLKELLDAVRAGLVGRGDKFFREEYALDLMLHEFPKPVLALTHGVTMGGGLGLAAGADMVVAAESTRLAMPETRIGFFPDVGATGWLFRKCPPGYPEYLALTGYEPVGAEGVRLGLATHLVPAARWGELRRVLADWSTGLPPEKPAAVAQLRQALESRAQKNIPSRPELDAWVAAHFAGKVSLREIVDSLSRDREEATLAEETLRRLRQRSPTALAVTLKLLRANEGRPLPEVFHREALAAHFMVQHPDYLEGIRALILDKDDQPRWQPQTIEELAVAGVEF